jgi:uncharacterized membrane protein YfcA
MTGYEAISLALAAAAGGCINAVAGGGTLVTFPSLLFFGTPAVIANATSTLALVVGTSGSLFGYRRHLAAVRPWLWRFIPVSLAGGIIGALLLTRTSNKVFEHLVPFLILFATVLFTLQGPIRKLLSLKLAPQTITAATGGEPAKHENHRHILLAIAFQFLVAIYGGYFGAGIGILMLASLGFIGLTDIYQMNTLKTILGSLINLVAAVWFIFAGLIHWPKAGIMTAGALVGYFLGAHYSQKISQKQVRSIITCVGFALSGVTFYKQFFK